MWHGRWGAIPAAALFLAFSIAPAQDTPFKESIGKAVTHGCIRLHDEDITWLYEHVPVGTVVVIH